MNCPQPYEKYEYDEKLSYRDFTNQTVSDSYDFSGKVIYQSCFSNEQPNSDIFGKIKGTTFIKCNLDNITIPDGCTVVDCSQKRFKIQSDGNDWLVDENDIPDKPVDYKIYVKQGREVPTKESLVLEPKVAELIQSIEKLQEVTITKEIVK